MGMDEKTMENIESCIKNANVRNEIRETKNIGIENVIRRCELYYGKNVVEFTSKLGEFTEFRIVL